MFLQSYVLPMVIFVVVGASPAQSQNVAAVPLPSNLAIIQPADSLPPEVKLFSGKWAGIWDDTLDHVLVVEEIESPDKAVVVYAHAKAPAWKIDKPTFTRAKGRIDAGVLEFKLRNGAVTVSYRLLPSGELAGKFETASIVARSKMKHIE